MAKKTKHQISIVFDSFEELEKFSTAIADAMRIGVYKADALDPEFGGATPKNSYVLRSINGMHGKPSDWRIA